MGQLRALAGVPNLERLALENTVIAHPDDPQRGRLWGGFSYRGPLLPQYGSRERELELRRLWHHDYNTIFRGAIAGLVKRVQSTPYEITAPDEDGDMWQELLMRADFGDWDRFLSKLITDYSRHDQGAFIELIAPGDPMMPAIGSVVGLSVLDSLRCYPTGVPEYPVIYYSAQGEMHVLHYTRVVQFVDTPDSEEGLSGYGDCALARAVAPVQREILMGRYVEQYLDDKPPPGIMAFGNLTDERMTQAIEKMAADSQRDDGGEWGRTVRLFGVQTDQKPTIDVVNYSKAPEGFDYEKYKTINVREIALAVGLDIQDIWELTGGNGLGTGTQSQILAEKSRGKALGRLLKSLERVINQALPEDVEFTFKFQDTQADTERTTQAQIAASAVQILAGILTVEEMREFVANSSEMFADVLIDERGQMRAYNDADPKKDTQTETVSDGTSTLEDVQNADPSASPTPDNPYPLNVLAKEFGATASAFTSQFRTFIADNNLSNTEQAILRTLLRERLRVNGVKAYRDGLADGGAEAGDVSVQDQAQAVNEWLVAQEPYVSNFIAELAGAGVSPASAGMRADMWVNKSLRAIYQAGIADADKDGLYAWHLGATEKHCRTCLSLNGQSHKMKDWVKSGYLPGSSTLECKGYQCDCRLEPSSGKPRGTLPGAKPSLGDRLLGWLRNIFRGGR